MKYELAVSLVLVSSLALLAMSSALAEDMVIPIVGKLVKADGSPATGDVSFTFKIYDNETNGNKVWSESKTLTLSSDGVFSTYLGSENPLPHDLPNDTWLEVVVNDEDTFKRVKLGFAPYSIGSENLQGKLPENFVSNPTEELTMNISDNGIDYIKIRNSDNTTVGKLEYDSSNDAFAITSLGRDLVLNSDSNTIEVQSNLDVLKDIFADSLFVNHCECNTANINDTLSVLDIQKYMGKAKYVHFKAGTYNKDWTLLRNFTAPEGTKLLLGHVGGSVWGGGTSKSYWVDVRLTCDNETFVERTHMIIKGDGTMYTLIDAPWGYFSDRATCKNISLYAKTEASYPVYTSVGIHGSLIPYLA